MNGRSVWLRVGGIISVCVCVVTPGYGVPAAGRAAASAPAPVPEPAAVARAEAAVAELFKPELAGKGAAERLALSKRFRAQAATGADDAAVRYVLLRRACDLAAEAADFDAAFAAAEELGAAFRIDAAALKLETLTKAAGGTRSAPAASALTAAACTLGEAAAERGEWDAVTKASALATAASRRAGDASVVSRAKALAKRATQAKADERQFQAAAQTLRRNPDDPKANLAAGRYLSLVRNDWAAGVPMLAKAAEPQVKALADREQTNPSTPDAMVALGDAWWDLPDGRGGITRAQARGRAGYWYEKALPGLKGIARIPVEARLTELRLAREAASPRLALERLERVTGSNSTVTAEGLEIRNRTQVRTPEEFAVPVRIELVAKAEKDNLRLYFADKGELIFNWELNVRELRVHDPTLGTHRGFPGRGFIQPGKWVTIQWLIEAGRMVVAVDGEERAVVEGDYANVRGKAGVGAINSAVTVKSWRVVPATPARGD